MAHDELEARLEVDARALVRQLYQDHLDLRSLREQRVSVVADAQGFAHRAVEADHDRPLATIFGEVRFARLGYRAKGAENLYVADAWLNLPEELYSYGLRERCCVEAARGSYEEAQEAIERSTGVHLGKRQVEQLARRGATDIDEFYRQAEHEPAAACDVVVISADGKGIVMRPEGLRPATKKAADQQVHKLKTRLSKGEKKNRKRIAELAVVYDAEPVARQAVDIIGRSRDDPKPSGPQAKSKWVTASVVDDPRQVIAEAFAEASRRDPGHDRTWVVLVDGAKPQRLS